MISKHLKEIFDLYVNLDIGVWENFEKLGEIKILPKETVLKESNTTQKNFNLIIKGSGGNLIWNKNNFVCIDISFENDFLNDYMSFTTQQPTPIEVRLFEDATIFNISYNNFQQILEVSNYGEKLTRLAVETVFIEKQQQGVAQQVSEDEIFFVSTVIVGLATTAFAAGFATTFFGVEVSFLTAMTIIF